LTDLNDEREDSLKKRYAYKLLTNLIGFGFSIITAGIIPRGLGPKLYGDYNFLTNFFTQTVSFFNSGTSFAFYTIISQRQREYGIIRFYWGFLLAVSLLVIIFISFSCSTKLNIYFWPDQEIGFIFLAAFFSLLIWQHQTVSSLIDAYALTTKGEIARIAQRALAVGLLLLMFFSKQFSLFNFFAYNYVILTFLIFVWWRILHNNFIPLFPKEHLKTQKRKEYIKEFYSYSSPLIVYAALGLVVGVLDRWLLQLYSGSIQQGFFGLSFRIGAICLMFTSAMTPLITREFAISFEKNDIPAMARLFRKYVPMLYSIAAYFGCFVVFAADKITFILGGEKYQQAGMTVAIMALYPIHGTYGQLCGSLFYSTGQTKTYRNVGIIFMLLGLPVVYFLIAPTDKLGLNAGATGLAIKMVTINFLWVNVLLYIMARFLGLPFWRYLGHQVLSMVCLLGCAGLATIFIDQGFGGHDQVILSFVLSGFLYTVLVSMVLFAKPMIFGLKRRDIRTILQFAVERIKRI